MSTPAPGYRQLLRVRGVVRMSTATLCARTGQGMAQVALVLYVLQRFHSPALTGVVVLLATAPGVLLSPLAGAVLDREGRVRMIVLDYGVALVTFLVLGILAFADRLSVGLLLGIVTASSLTGPLSATGARSLLPLIVPHRLWDRANALDSGGYVLSTLIGPPLAGVITAFAGGPAALLTVGAVYLPAMVLMAGLHDVTVRSRGAGLLRQSWDGLRYVAGNRTLRGLALALSVYNIGFGGFIVAMPVLVLHDLGGGSATVGLLFAAIGAAGIVSGVLAGRADSRGREIVMLCGGIVGAATGFLVCGLAPATWVVLVGVLIIGVTNGPLDIALFGLRQRRTHPHQLGRAFAVSMALNYAGNPLGSALAGPVSAVSARWALLGGAAVAVVGALLGLLFVPATAEEHGIVTLDAGPAARGQAAAESPPGAGGARTG